MNALLAGQGAEKTAPLSIQAMRAGGLVPVQRGPFDRLFKRKKKQEVTFTVTGGRSGNQDRFGENKAQGEVEYSDYASEPVVFFQDTEWMAHFLKWVAGGPHASAVSKPLLEVFVQANVRRIDGDTLTRSAAFAFVTGVLAPRMADQAVAKIVASREGGQSGLDSLRELCSTEEYFRQGKPGQDGKRGASGKKVLDGKAGKLYFNVVDLFNGYRTYLATPEGKRDQTRPLTAAKFPTSAPKWTSGEVKVDSSGSRGDFRLGSRPSKPPNRLPPSVPSKLNGPPNFAPPPVPTKVVGSGRPLPPIPDGKTVRSGRPLPPIPRPMPNYPAPLAPSVSERLNERQSGVLETARQEALDKAAENREKAKAQLLKAGVKEDQLDTVLDQVIEYIKSAKITINFNPSHGKFALYEQIGGYTPLWMAPKEKIEQETPGYLDKRNKVEQHFFGYEDDPHQSGLKGDRPVYASASLGDTVGGGAEQYGYSYFELNEEVKQRSTYSQRDTFSGFDVKGSGPQAPKTEGSSVENIGSHDHLEGVVADMAPAKLAQIVEQMTGQKGERGLGENQYVELHVHGGVDWGKDVKRIVIDRNIVKPGSRLETHLVRFARHYNIPIAYYNRKQWEESAMSDLKGANLQHAPRLEQQELKLGTSDQSAPGTIVGAEIKPDQQELMITTIKQEEKGSPVTQGV